MTPSSERLTALLRRALVALATLALTAGIALVGAGAAQAAPKHGHGQPAPAVIPLPDGFLPEGIAISGQRVYSGSRVTGDIYVADLRTGKGRILSAGSGKPSLGLKVDGRRLWVAGGGSREARVVDTRSGKVLARLTLTPGPGFINDVVLVGRYAWFTDSLQAQLYRVDRRHPERGVKTVKLTGAWVQVREFNANGITRAPGGKGLLVVNSTTGQLFRVDTRTGAATVVDLNGASLVNGDGMLLRGRTLYVVQNVLNRVAVVRLDARATSGEVRRTITSPAFDVPSTVARSGRYLYLPNARFGAADAGSTTYSITRVRS